MIDVTVKIQEDRVAEFYAMYADWLREAPAKDAGNDGRRDWTSDDDEQAHFVWSNLHPKAMRLFEILLSASRPVAGRDLAVALGEGAREETVFGTFGPPAKLAKEVGRKHMITSEHSVDGNSYWMEPTVKSLFERVRSERGDPR